jgi:hypothetical protein
VPAPAPEFHCIVPFLLSFLQVAHFDRWGRSDEMDWNMKLFEEIARSLRLVKGDHQPEILEPETPTCDGPGSLDSFRGGIS